MTKKEEKFIEKFINLYMDKFNLEYALKDDENNSIDKKELEKANKKIKAILPKYPILFEGNINILHKIFNKLKSKRKDFAFNGKFKLFLKWVFDDLYKEKIINEVTFNELEKFLVGFNLESRNLSLTEIGGLGI